MKQSETAVTLNIEELLILNALLAAHRLVAIDRVPEPHWVALLDLSNKMVIALSTCTKQVDVSTQGQESKQTKPREPKVDVKPRKEETNGGRDAVQEGPSILE